MREQPPDGGSGDERLPDPGQGNPSWGELEFKRFLNRLPAGAYTCDPDGLITYFNPQAVEVWGRAPRLNDPTDRFCGSFRLYAVDGTPIRHDQCWMARALQDNEGYNGCEILIERPSGDRRTVLAYANPVHDPHGSLVGAVNVLVDITERKRSEDVVQQSERRFREAFAHALVGIAFTDLSCRFVEVNEAFARITGYTHEELRGMDCHSLTHPEDRAHSVECARRLFTGDVSHFDIEKRFVRKDGSTAWVRNSVSLLRDLSGRPTSLIVLCTDVTESRKGEQAQRLLAAIVESSDDAIISKDLQGTVTSWNRGAQRMYGYTPAEAIGQNISFLMPPDHADDGRLILSRICRGERVEHFETKRRSRDGRILDVSVTVSPIRDSENRIVGASKIARDITDRKRAEAALRRSEEQLRDANRRKDEFLAMLAHELRNPLSAISSAVQVARRSDLSEHREWSNDVIERQVRHLSRMIDDLMDVSRITRGKIRLRRELVDAGPILQSALEIVRPLIEERKHELTVSFRPGSLCLRADPVRLEQVVVNLLTNAAKYTEAGGHIWLTAEPVDSEVVIRVRDNGIGMPPEFLPQMFELFTQGDRSLARSEGGLGIGLTLVKNLVEMHSGTVSASSPGVGQGSEFTVRLPAAVGARPERRAATRPTERNGSEAARILVVDDNPDSARGLARLLKLLGHQVESAHDGPQALEAARSFHPDVVLLDIGLPGMDGYEVARRLRTEGGCVEASIIAVSGYGQEHDLQRGREAGFDHHLVKPVDHDALLSLLMRDGPE